MSEFERYRYQRKKLVSRVCGPLHTLKNTLVRTNILILCLRKMTLGSGERTPLERRGEKNVHLLINSSTTS